MKCIRNFGRQTWWKENTKNSLGLYGENIFKLALREKFGRIFSSSKLGYGSSRYQRISAHMNGVTHGIRALVCCHAACSGNSLPNKFLQSWPFKMGPIGCLETSLGLINKPQERRSYLHHSECLKSHRVIHLPLSLGSGTFFDLRHSATSRKVAGSIPDGVIRIFHWHNTSGRTMALGLTQPPKWVPRIFSGG
jgi:hypothetical protein